MQTIQFHDHEPNAQLFGLTLVEHARVRKSPRPWHATIRSNACTKEKNMYYITDCV